MCFDIEFFDLPVESYGNREYKMNCYILNNSTKCIIKVETLNLIKTFAH